MSTKHRIKLVVAYDGYDFCGWAPQAGQRTVHGTLTEGIRRISGEENEIIGASRTDGGAHAKGQVCHFDTEVRIPIESWARVVNKVLPPDLSILKATIVSRKFHSRFWANSRTYRYRILTGLRDPRRTRYAHFYGRPLDAEQMNQVVKKLIGVHDFLGFSQLIPPGTNTVREVYEASVKQRNDEVWLDVKGTAFLRGMMRRIAGSLIDVGREKKDGSYLDYLLEQRSKEGVQWPTILPAHGLTLLKVTYGRHPSDKRSFIDLDIEE